MVSLVRFFGTVVIVMLATKNVDGSCTNIINKGPFVNGTHYCLHCTLYFTKPWKFRAAYGCGCNKWKPLKDGCCRKNRTVCNSSKVVPIRINGTTAPQASNTFFLTHPMANSSHSVKRTYDKLPYIAAGFISIIVVILTIRIYSFIRSRRRNQIRRNAELRDSVIHVELEMLKEYKV